MKKIKIPGLDYDRDVVIKVYGSNVTPGHYCSSCYNILGYFLYSVGFITIKTKRIQHEKNLHIF